MSSRHSRRSIGSDYQPPWDPLKPDGTSNDPGRWDNLDIDVGENTGYNREQTPIYRNSMIPSGSQGMLGETLEKLYKGEVLSQHAVSSALRDYNQMLTTIEDLEQRTKHMKLHTTPEEILKKKTAVDMNHPDIVVMNKGKKDRLQEQIKRKDELIDDLQRKLKSLSHATTTRAERNIRVEEIVPPKKIVDEFCDLYEKEWSYAFEVLKASWKNEERVLHTLFRIVRHAYVFCFDIAETQRAAVEDFSIKLQEAMLHPTFNHPVTKLKYKASAMVGVDTQKHVDVGRKLIGDYRNVLVTQSIAGVQELFRKVKLPEIFESEFVNKAVRDYVDRTVELIWLMVIQEPPMMVYWLEPKRTVLPDYFTFFKNKGIYIKQMVWPAVFIKEDGGIMSKGVVLASMTNKGGVVTDNE